MSIATAFAVSAWNNTQPIDLRVSPPAHLLRSVDALLETVASVHGSSDGIRYLPEDFLPVLLG